MDRHMVDLCYLAPEANLSRSEHHSSSSFMEFYDHGTRNAESVHQPNQFGNGVRVKLSETMPDVDSARVPVFRSYGGCGVHIRNCISTSSQLTCRGAPGDNWANEAFPNRNMRSGGGLGLVRVRDPAQSLPPIRVRGPSRPSGNVLCHNTATFFSTFIRFARSHWHATFSLQCLFNPLVPLSLRPSFSFLLPLLSSLYFFPLSFLHPSSNPAPPTHVRKT
ncbi:hypothetical protein BC827DRAFT_882906 [Russula dissimulans]|nr:hypothetical protein BC827DRAFT_882906 [Russula dissimulans]